MRRQIETQKALPQTQASQQLAGYQGEIGKAYGVHVQQSPYNPYANSQQAYGGLAQGMSGCLGGFLGQSLYPSLGMYQTSKRKKKSGLSG